VVIGYMPKTDTITVERVRQTLSYEPKNGELRWRMRTPDMFKGSHAERLCRAFNAQNANKVAGCVCTSGHKQIKIDGISIMAHRAAYAIMKGEWPAHEIDHKDVSHANNTWGNIRDATRSQNRANTGPTKRNKLGVKGVYKKKNRYVASIRIGGKLLGLGYFKTIEEASSAYEVAAKRHFGEYARTE
jgi:hypothetical protein